MKKLMYKTKYKHLREGQRQEILEFAKSNSLHDVIVTTLERNWRRSLVAECLGIHERTVYQYLHRLNNPKKKEKQKRRYYVPTTIPV